jgi:hypothetical protein
LPDYGRLSLRDKHAYVVMLTRIGGCRTATGEARDG